MKRILFSDNGTLKDFTTDLKNYHTDTSTVDFTLNEDVLYIGSELPFNSLYFDTSTPNTQASSVSIKYWSGSDWRSMVEAHDETDLGGASLGQSGHITWVTDKNKAWISEDTVDSNGSENITGLGDVTIYDLYWLKVEFSASLDVTTALNWVGPKFCSNDDLISEYTLFGKTSLMAAYETGKVNWENEIILASRLIIDKLIGENVIVNGDQLLSNDKMKDICVSKTAHLILKNLGEDYNEDKDNAQKEYKNRLDFKAFTVDRNNNGRKDKSEQKVVTGVLFR